MLCLNFPHLNLQLTNFLFQFSYDIKCCNIVIIWILPTLSGVLSSSHRLEGKAVVPVQQITCVTPYKASKQKQKLKRNSEDYYTFPLVNETTQQNEHISHESNIIKHRNRTLKSKPQIWMDPNPLASSCLLWTPIMFKSSI